MPLGKSEYYGCALRDINVYSPFIQPTLKVVVEWLRVSEKQRLLARRAYDGRVFHVESQHDVVCG
jgi:hypothetical protein